MSLRASASCPHELRPGTKVCLHCRRAERDARIARRNRTFRKLGFTALGIGACAYAGVAGWDAFQRGSLPKWPELMAATAKLPGKLAAKSLPEPPDRTPPPAPAAMLDAALILPVPVASDSTLAVVVALPSRDTSAIAAPAAEDTSGVASPPHEPPVLEPIVAQGRTDLHDGIYAFRAGDSVTVHFDTPEARTRRADKFEQIVRATLPAVHGAPATELLASIPLGALVGPFDLIAELPARGIHFRTSDGRGLSIWPEARPGRDGLLIVAYRATQLR